MDEGLKEEKARGFLESRGQCIIATDHVCKAMAAFAEQEVEAAVRIAERPGKCEEEHADFAAEQLARSAGWVAELPAVFKRNIAMHENGPAMNGHLRAADKLEMQGFIRGLRRGLEIVEMSRPAASGEGEGK